MWLNISDFGLFVCFFSFFVKIATPLKKVIPSLFQQPPLSKLRSCQSPLLENLAGCSTPLPQAEREGGSAHYVNKNVQLNEIVKYIRKLKGKKTWITKGTITSIHKRNFYLKNLEKQITNSSVSNTNML